MSRDRINQLRNSRPVPPPEIRTHSDATAGESSVRPQNKDRRFMRKVKNGVIKKIVQDALSVEQDVDIQSTAGKQTSSQQSTSSTTSIFSDTITAGKQTPSQQSTSRLTSPTSLSIHGGPATSPAPTDSTHSSEMITTGITKSTSSLTTDSHADTYTTPQSLQTGSSDSPTPTLPTTFSGGSSAIVSATQSFCTLQSPGGSSVNTPISTGHVFTVSSVGLPTPFSGSVGNPVSNTLHSAPSAVANNALSSTSSIPPSGDTFSSTTYTSTGTFTFTQWSTSGSTSILVTLTSTSTSVIRTITPVPISKARSNEASIIGGIVGGVLALLLVCIAACYLIRRKRRLRTSTRDSDISLTLTIHQ